MNRRVKYDEDFKKNAVALSYGVELPTIQCSSKRDTSSAAASTRDMPGRNDHI